jgi:hypothetical protein
LADCSHSLLIQAHPERLEHRYVDGVAGCVHY